MYRTGILVLFLCSCVRAGYRIDDNAEEHGALNLLAVTINTSATIELATALAAMSEYEAIETNNAIPLDLPAAVTSALGDRAVVWSRPLLSTEKEAWTTLPESVHLTFGISQDGILLVAAASDNPEDVLSVLTSGGIEGHHTATFGYPISAEQKLTHHLLDLDQRANLLAEFGFRAYLQLHQSGSVSDGLSPVCSTYGCDRGMVIPGYDQLPCRLFNGFGQNIAVLQSAVFASQSDTRWACGCPFDGIAFKDGPWARLEEALNRAWNPKESDTTDGPASRRFELTHGKVDGSYISAYADGDNSNSGTVTLDGKVVSQFAGWDDASHLYRQNSIMPESVELELDNSWSVSSAVFRIAVLGDTPTVHNNTESPTGGLDSNPEPQTWIIHAGWNE